MYSGTQKVIPTPDFRIYPGARKYRKTQENWKLSGGRDSGVGITFWLLVIGGVHRRKGTTATTTTTTTCDSSMTNSDNINDTSGNDNDSNMYK